MPPARHRRNRVQYRAIWVTHPGNAETNRDTRIQSFFPIEADRTSRDRLGFQIETGRRLRPPLDCAEVLLGESPSRSDLDVSDQHQRGIVGQEVVLVHLEHALSIEAGKVARMPTVRDIDRMGQRRNPINGVMKGRLGSAEAIQNLLENREALRLPATQDGIRHAIGLLAKEQLDSLHRKIHTDLQVLLLRTGGNRVFVACQSAVAAVPVVLFPKHPQAGLLIFEPIELLPEPLDLRCRGPIELVIEHVADTQLVALTAASRKQRLLGLVNLTKNRKFGFEVNRPDSGSALVYHMFQEMGGTVFTGRFLHGTKAVPEARGNPGHALIFYDEHTETIVENALLDFQWGRTPRDRMKEHPRRKKDSFVVSSHLFPTMLFEPVLNVKDLGRDRRQHHVRLDRSSSTKASNYPAVGEDAIAKPTLRFVMPGVTMHGRSPTPGRTRWTLTERTIASSRWPGGHDGKNSMLRVFLTFFTCGLAPGIASCCKACHSHFFWIEISRT